MTIVAGTDAAGTFINTAVTHRNPAFPLDPDLTKNRAAAAVTVVLPPVDISITKTVSPSAVEVGQSTAFTIVVTNHGPAAAVDVVAADQLPPGLTPTSVSDTACTIAGQSVSCAFGVLGPAATRQFVVTTTATAAGA